MLILQTLSVTWTKNGRGAPLATRRNRLPRALPLPEALLAGAQGWHQQHWSEPAPPAADFFAHAPTVKIWPQLPARLNNGLAFSVAADRLLIDFTDPRGGQRRCRRLFVLGPGQTAQLRLNERGVGFDDPYYRQHTHNFAWGRPYREIFSQRPLDYRLSLENRLF